MMPEQRGQNILLPYDTVWIILVPHETKLLGTVVRSIWNCLIGALLPGECLTQDTGNIQGPCPSATWQICVLPRAGSDPRVFQTPFPARIMLIPQKGNRSKVFMEGVKRGTSPFLELTSQEYFYQRVLYMPKYKCSTILEGGILESLRLSLLCYSSASWRYQVA